TLDLHSFPTRRSSDLVTEEWLRSLEKDRRVAAIRIAGETRWIAAEDAGRYREAMGASLPIGLPDAFLEPGANPLESLLRRYARTHVPFVTSDPSKRWGLPAAAIESALARLAARGEVGGSRSAGLERWPRRPLSAR